MLCTAHQSTALRSCSTASLPRHPSLRAKLWHNWRHCDVNESLILIYYENVSLILITTFFAFSFKMQICPQFQTISRTGLRLCQRSAAQPLSTTPKIIASNESFIIFHLLSLLIIRFINCFAKSFAKLIHWRIAFVFYSCSQRLSIRPLIVC